MKQKIFIGNYSAGIKEYEIDENGDFNYLLTIGNVENNSYLLKYNDYLYSVIEDEKGKLIQYDFKGNRLSEFGCGKLPCFLSFDEKRNIIYVANYLSGSFDVFKIDNYGRIIEKLFTKDYGKSSNIHYIKSIKDKLYVIDLGKSILYEYYISYSNDKFELIEKDKILFPKDSEPRHLTIDDTGNIFLVTEKSCKIYKLFYKNGKLEIQNSKSIILPINMSNINNTGCAIKYYKNRVYVSVRGDNSISVFDTETLEMIQNIDCEGICPRDISFDKTGSFFLCANQLSDNIAIFTIDNFGKLSYKNSINIEKPSCIIIDK